jgi:putative flippase GtrA
VTPRYGRFLTIGVAGFVLQLTALWLLTSRARWPWLPATLVSVELAVVHNYVWHARWTWRDRPGPNAMRFIRFQFANGLASIAGNALLMALLAGTLGMPVLCANAIAVAVTGILNFLSADRWIFRRGGLRIAVAIGAATMLAPSPVSAQTPETLDAWNRYVIAVEARLDRSRNERSRRPALDLIVANGEGMHVPSGTISDWRGSVFLPGVTLECVLDRLQHPGTPPPQEDVASSHVVARTGDSLRVAIRLVRHAIVTVTYDTEHDMRFDRWTPHLATARSIATRIDEVGGTDHGFLWRLNSYWKYEEMDGGVLVSLESLTLSRDVPSLIRPVAGPLITRVARESVVRTLDALRRFYGG